MHAPLNKAGREENTVCKYCEQLAAASEYSYRPEYFDHHPSILSFRESSERCPLCQQLLQWINKDTLAECRILENYGCRTTINFKRTERAAADVQTFQGILHWIFLLDTSKKFPMEREVWRPTLKHSSGASVHLVVAHGRG
jgi:hypothetical protein